jgi:hypothetical protein
MDQDLLLSCENRDHPHRVVLDGEVVSLRDHALAGGHSVMFYFALNGRFEIPGYARALERTPAVVPITPSYGLDQVHAAAKAVLLSRNPSGVRLDEVTDIVVRLMRALRLAARSDDDCACVILAVCRELGVAGAGRRLALLSARPRADAPPEPETAPR